MGRLLRSGEVREKGSIHSGLVTNAVANRDLFSCPSVCLSGRIRGGFGLGLGCEDGDGPKDGLTWNRRGRVLESQRDFNFGEMDIFIMFMKMGWLVTIEVG